MGSKKTRQKYRSISVLFLVLVMWITSAFSVCAVTSESDESEDPVQAQRLQVQETMQNAVDTQVQFEEIVEFNPDLEGYEHIKAITYDGLEYNEQKTKVFAYVGFPEGASADAKVPAVVLVHGGTGHPYLEWVRQWNERGYAAIAMENTGYFPSNKNDGLDEAHDSGFIYGLHGIFEEEGYVSAPNGGSYPANYKELEQQWPYHALAQIILAHNVLRQDERVDTDNIGITGVSWGGVLTSQVIGYDNRFSFAIPVYGSAYLGNEVRPFDNFECEYTDALWAAERNLDNATMPILWCSWNDDYFFSIPGTMRSYLHTEGFNNKNTVLLLDNWEHSHYSAWSKEHSYLFADWVTYGEGGFTTFDTQPEGRNISCTIDIPEDVTGDISAKLYYITEPMSYSRNDKFGTGSTFWRLDQIWQVDATSLTVDRETGVVSGVIPDEARGYYIQLTYSIEDNNYEASSIFVSVDAVIPEGGDGSVSGGDGEPAVTITIEAESHTAYANADPYIRDTGEAVQYWGGTNCYSTWTLDIEDSDVYTFKTIGTGMVYPDTEYTTVIGRWYIDNELVNTLDMTTNEKYNPWENPLETVLGAVELQAGSHTVRFEVEGGTYIMDKMLIESETLAGEDDSVSDGDAGELVTITIEAESHTAYASADPYIRDEGEAVQYWGGTNCYSTWTLDIEENNVYTFKTIGTGMVYPDTDYTTVIGKWYINNELVNTLDMTTNEKYNPWDNPLVTVLGAVELQTGTYTVRFEVEGGTYIMDKMLIESVTLVDEDDSVSDGDAGDGSVSDGDAGDGSVSDGDAAEPVTITVEAENYISASGTEAYDRDTGAAIKYLGTPGSTSHTVTIPSDGTYSITTIGTGMISSGFSAIIGSVYVDNVLVIDAVPLTTNEKFNPWDNPLESNLGTVELTAGTHTITFSQVRGVYVMDKMIIATSAAE